MERKPIRLLVELSPMQENIELILQGGTITNISSETKSLKIGPTPSQSVQIQLIHERNPCKRHVDQSDDEDEEEEPAGTMKTNADAETEGGGNFISNGTEKDKYPQKEGSEEVTNVTDISLPLQNGSATPAEDSPAPPGVKPLDGEQNGEKITPQRKRGRGFKKDSNVSPSKKSKKDETAIKNTRLRSKPDASEFRSDLPKKENMKMFIERKWEANGLPNFVCKLCGFQLDQERYVQKHVKLRHSVDWAKRPQDKSGVQSDSVVTPKGRREGHFTRKRKPRNSFVEETDSSDQGDTPKKDSMELSSPTLNTVNECSLCGKEFPSRQTFHSHIQLVHNIALESLKLQYSCIKCQSEFVQLTTYENHMINVHSATGKFACTVAGCDAKLPTQAGLTRHIIRKHKSAVNESAEPEGTGDKEPAVDKVCEESSVKSPMGDKTETMEETNESLLESPAKSLNKSDLGSFGFACTEEGCNAVFSGQPGLRRHITRKHKDGSSSPTKSSKSSPRKVQKMEEPLNANQDSLKKKEDGISTPKVSDASDESNQGSDRGSSRKKKYFCSKGCGASFMSPVNVHRHEENCRAIVGHGSPAQQIKSEQAVTMPQKSSQAHVSPAPLVIEPNHQQQQQVTLGPTKSNSPPLVRDNNNTVKAPNAAEQTMSTVKSLLSTPSQFPAINKSESPASSVQVQLQPKQWIIEAARTSSPHQPDQTHGAATLQPRATPSPRTEAPASGGKVACSQCGQKFMSVVNLQRHEMFSHPRWSSVGTGAPTPAADLPQHPPVPADAARSSPLDLSSPGDAGETTQATLVPRRSSDPLRPHACSMCHKTFGSTPSLRTHVKTVHQKIKDIVCPWSGCGKVFGRSSHLDNHMKRHRGEMNFSCQYCDYRCIQRASLNYHMRNIHPSEFYDRAATKVKTFCGGDAGGVVEAPAVPSADSRHMVGAAPLMAEPVSNNVSFDNM